MSHSYLALFETGWERRTRVRAFLCVVVAFALLGFAIAARAQAPPPPAQAASSAQVTAPPVPKLLPESGVVTADDYRNQFYEFAFGFPAGTSAAEVQRRFPRSNLMYAGAHALLSAFFRVGEIDTELGIQSWDEHSGKIIDAAKAAKEEASSIQKQKRIVTRGPHEVRVGKDVVMQYIEEWSFRADRAIFVLFLVRKGHLIRIVALTTDPQTEAFGKWFIKAIRFEDYAAPEIMQSYTGPTVPTYLVDDALAQKPGLKLPNDARVEGDSWVSATLGMRYRFPAGWKPTPASAPDLFLRYHPLRYEETAPIREQGLLRACSRPLLQVTGPRDSAPGTPANEEPPSLTLLAADEACLGVPYPTISDRTSIAEYISALTLLPDCGDVRSPQFLFINGALFFDIRGLVSYHPPESKFALRRAQAVYVGRFRDAHGGYQLLLWFFTAAHENQIPGFAKNAIELLPAP